MTVRDMNKDIKYTIKNLNCDSKMRSHLIAMGFVPGFEIQLIMHRFGGYVIECLGGRYAIGKSLAEQIELEVND